MSNTLKKTPLKKIIYTIIGLVVVFGMRFVPAPEGLNSDSMAVIGCFLGVLFLWITIGIDWPSLLCIAALAFVPSLGGINEVLKASFGNATFAFLLFTFMCTYALSQTGYVRKIALSFATSKIAKKSPWHLAILFLLSVLIVGWFMSPTVLYFIMLPILEEIYDILKLKKGDKYAEMLMIGMVTCTSLSSAMTPIAHVFPVLAIGVFESATNTTVNYAAYMGFAIPAGLLLFTAMMLIFRFVMKPNLENFKGLSEDDFETSSEQSTINEKFILAIFMLVVALWVVPGLIKPIAPGVYKFINSFGTAMPPLIGVLLLSIIRINDKPLLNFGEAMTKGVSWPSLIMSASTLVLGSAMTNEAIGLTTFITNSMSQVTANLPAMLMVLLFVTWAGIQSNVSSHMVTSSLVASIAVPIAMASGGILNAGAIACVIGWVASIGSATPPSMPYVAVAGSSGWTNAQQLMKYGFLIMIVMIVIAAFVAYPIASILI